MGSSSDAPRKDPAQLDNFFCLPPLPVRSEKNDGRLGRFIGAISPTRRVRDMSRPLFIFIYGYGYRA